MGDRAKAIDFYNRAVVAVNDKQNPAHLLMGYQLFASAVAVDPTWGLGWYQLGNNNHDLERQFGSIVVQAAIADWNVALTNDLSNEERGRALCNLANAYYNFGRTNDAWEANQIAEELVPDQPLVYLNKSLIFQQRGHSKLGVANAREAYKRDPESLEMKMVLAFALLFDGQYREGFELFEHRFEWRLPHYLHFPYPKWDGRDAANAVVVLSADQGLGDTLSFSRFVPMLSKRVKHIHMLVQSPLIRPFTYMFETLGNVSIAPSNPPFPPADAWTTFVSLPYVLKLSDAEVRDQTFDTLIPRFRLPTDWKMPDRKLHIGISWSGSPMNDINRHRNIPLEYFFELFRVPGIALYSFQVDEKKDLLTKSGSAVLIRDMSPYINDISDTCTLLDELDLVITCESALGHICGSIGKECWIPYSYIGKDYRAGLTGAHPLWYKNHKFYQQSSKLSWQEVFDNICYDLRARLE